MPARAFPAATALMLFSSALLLGGCASAPKDDEGQATATPPVMASRPWSESLAAGADKSRLLTWQHYTLPGKRSTHYDFVQSDGRSSVRASSASSASMLRTVLQVAPQDIGMLEFSWKVPQLIDGADLGVREHDDAPARIVLAFEGDRSRFTVRESAMAELARAITGEEMPYATLMYVWCNKRPVGTVIEHPRSSRIRSIVVESGPARLGQWTIYRRDVRADFERAFGEAPGKLSGMALMTDSDNTKKSAQAWYGPLRIGTPVATAP